MQTMTACDCVVPCNCCAPNVVADSLGVSPEYHQQDSQRWTQAAEVYADMIEHDLSVRAPGSPPNTPGMVAAAAHTYVRRSRASLPPRHLPHSRTAVSSQCHSPTNSGRGSTVYHYLHKALGNEARRDSLPNLSMGLSLNKVGSLNRSLAGTNPASRGEQSLELEAIAAVHELSFAVQQISVSEMLPRTPDLIFVNVTTVEGQPYCLELTLKGWRITSLRTDCMIGDFTRLDLFTKYYDSLYALMDDISPGYRVRFGEKLANKLKMLQHGEDMDCMAPNGSYASPPLSLSLSGSDRGSTESLPVVTPVSSPTISFDKPVFA